MGDNGQQSSALFTVRGVIEAAIGLGLLWAVEYSVLSMIEEAPFLFKAATGISALAALGVFAFKHKIISVRYLFGGLLTTVVITYLAISGVFIYLYRDVSPVKIKIVGIEFSKENPSYFNVSMHLRNQGVPSTVSDCVVSIYVNGELLQKFAPRELVAAPGLGQGMEYQRGLYLFREPLASGAETNTGVQFTVWGSAKEQFGRSGTRFHVRALDINDRTINADYTIP